MGKIVIAMIMALLLAGGGIAIAHYGPGHGSPGVKAGSDGDASHQFEMHLSEDADFPVEENGSEENDIEENGKDKGEQRSDVAKAVQEVLSHPTGLKPGDEGFGQAVAENARAGNLGEKVSEAARGANPSGGGNPGKGKGKPNR